MTYINYKVCTKSLTGALLLCLEMESEFGLTPDSIDVDDSRSVAFDLSDAKLVRDGNMSVADYVRSHRLEGG